MTATITATLDATNAKADITLTWTHPVALVVRVDNATRAVTLVKGGGPATLTAGVWTASDYEAPLGTDFYYQATGGLERISSQVYNLTNTTRACWLKHMTTPALNLKTLFTKVPNVSRPGNMTLVSVLDRSLPVAITDIRGAARGSIDLTTNSLAQRTALINLLADGSVLLIQAPPDYTVSNFYAVIGDVNQESFGTAQIPDCRWSLMYTAVDRPIVEPGLPNTWGNLLLSYPLWSNVSAAQVGYATPTWGDILTGVPSTPINPLP